MLKMTKNTTLNGEISIDGTVACYMNAAISSNLSQSTNISTTITNQEIYSKNRVAIRKDLDAYRDKVYELEDKMIAEAEAEVPKEVKEEPKS